jgi:hypothetical protein
MLLEVDVEKCFAAHWYPATLLTAYLSLSSPVRSHAAHW